VAVSGHPKDAGDYQKSRRKRPTMPKISERLVGAGRRRFTIILLPRFVPSHGAGPVPAAECATDGATPRRQGVRRSIDPTPTGSAWGKALPDVIRMDSRFTASWAKSPYVGPVAALRDGLPLLPPHRPPWGLRIVTGHRLRGAR
jgi:hypothetical protein